MTALHCKPRGASGRSEILRRALHSLAAVLLFLIAAPAVAQDYLGSDRCIACHTEAGEAWEESHHALAWTAPTADNIRADFDGTEFRLGDMHARFSLSPEGKARVSVTERDQVTTEYDVHSVIGVEPLQQYILETDVGFDDDPTSHPEHV